MIQFPFAFGSDCTTNYMLVVFIPSKSTNTINLPSNDLISKINLVTRILA